LRRKPEYQTLHNKIVSHLVSLKNIALDKNTSTNLGLFQFREREQNWLGFCKYGNKGKGLALNFKGYYQCFQWVL
jgi:hypothetical protein